MTTSTIKITINGQRALTAPQLADELGIDRDQIRTMLRRAGVTAAGRIDDRTPVYLAAVARRALRPRVG